MVPSTYFWGLQCTILDASKMNVLNKLFTKKYISFK